MLKKEENVPIGAHTTFGIGGTVRYLVQAQEEADIPDAVALVRQTGLPLVLLGEGSNSIFSGGALDAVVVKILIPGFSIVGETETYADMKIGAGEHWDDIVARAVDAGLSGIEAMSAIPGTAGATPFQNVGAYGQEIKDTLVSVRAYDTKKGLFVELANAECAFGYRDSIFRSGEKGRHIISSIMLRLSKLPPKMPDYPGVKKYFHEKGITTPSLAEIRTAIIDIRKTKLPDPREVKNAGSFFKNPIVEAGVAETIKAEHPALIAFPTDNGMLKLSAGWLIEHAGLKGVEFGPIRVYEKNALVLINTGNATGADLEKAKNAIIETVKATFDVTLDPEPIFIQ
jgi:UDP-N-acetylmuramate dehydrogenase